MVFVLLTPLSHAEIFGAYVLAAMVRGLLVGAVVFVTGWVFFDVPIRQPLWTITFAVLSTALSGSLGILAGIWAEKFDQMAAWQNFVILPLTFLSGAFYSIHTLPPFWAALSRFNPFFYMIDGFRYGLLGSADISPWESLLIVGGACLALSWTTLAVLRSGWRLRN